MYDSKNSIRRFSVRNCTQFIEACVTNDVFRVKNGGSLLGSHLYDLGGIGCFLRRRCLGPFLNIRGEVLICRPVLLSLIPLTVLVGGYSFLLLDSVLLMLRRLRLQH